MLVNCQMSPVIIFRLNILSCGPFNVEHPKRKKNRFFIPGKVRKVHPSFLYGSPHPVTLRACNQHVSVDTRLKWLKHSIANLSLIMGK